MNAQEILAMKPGKRLNILVAQEIFDLAYIQDPIFGDIVIFSGENSTSFGFLPHYSEDLPTARTILQKADSSANLKKYRGRWEANVQRKKVYYYYPDLNATSRPEAICKAALLAKMENNKTLQ
jgi:hypothetical protein